MAKKRYKSITSPNYLNSKLDPSNTISVLRTNNDNVLNIIKHFNDREKNYYITFLDGDNWKERDCWKNNYLLDKYDPYTSYELFMLSPFKDAIFQWADEYIIISPYNLDNKIKDFLSDKDFSMTWLILKTNYANYNTIAKLSHIVRQKKEINKGVSYYIDYDKDILGWGKEDEC